MSLSVSSVHPASFRDPSGFVFTQENQLYRQINRSYASDYDHLIASGLYESLVKEGLLVPHRELSDPESARLRTTGDRYKVVQPQTVNFVSYPFEWSFSQLQDAALATLKIQRLALEKGMSLKDASAYNIQFVRGRPVLIDTLSFERYKEGAPWVAYRQYCQHFLGPLLLMEGVDVRLGLLSRLHIDGVPLDLVSRMLSRRSWLDPANLMHIHLHSRAQGKYADAAAGSDAVKPRQRPVSKNGLLGIVDSLTKATAKRRWRPEGTEWGDYYSGTNYTDASFDLKARLIKEMKARINPAPKVVLDLGANTGHFSRMMADDGAFVVASDIDPAAIEQSYRSLKKDQVPNVLPLLLDVTNPTSSFGFSLAERQDFFTRGRFELVLSLALIHHLAISNNIPLARLANFYAGFSPWLIIEFVPKSDSQVKRLLASRPDIFPDYNQDGFEAAFNEKFTLVTRQSIQGSDRTLYLWQRRGE